MILTWRDNIENRIKKANNALYISKQLIGKKWGLKPKLIHWIYTAVVRPILTYGCVVWWTALNKKTYLENITKVQRLACLFITGAMRSTPTSALEVMLGLHTLDLFCQSNAAKKTIRLNYTATYTDGSWSRCWCLFVRFKFLTFL